MSVHVPGARPFAAFSSPAVPLGKVTAPVTGEMGDQVSARSGGARSNDVG